MAGWRIENAMPPERQVKIDDLSNPMVEILRLSIKPRVVPDVYRTMEKPPVRRPSASIQSAKALTAGRATSISGITSQYA